ncbi:MAG: AEC family transporter [Anaerolineales bacterium]
MSELFALFFNNLFPILLAACIGFALAKWLKINPRPLSQVIFYVFTPILVFNLIINSKLSNQDILRTLVFAIVLMVCVGGLTWLIGGILRLDRRMLAAVMITAMFMNAGNYGLPLTNFAFGETALAFASVFFVINAMFTNTVGIVIASSGSMSVLNAIKGLIKFPAIYALTLGILFLQFGWKLPSGLDRSVTLLSNAAIPCMLVLLGMQLVNIRLDGHVLPLILTSSMRLLIAPALAFGLTKLFGMSGPSYQAVVLEAAMPVAVLTTILATEFDAEPTFVTTAVLVTTLLSPLTLTPLLAFLGA